MIVLMELSCSWFFGLHIKNMNGSKIKANIVLFGYKIACKSGHIDSIEPNTHAAEANQTGALMTGSEYIQLASFECDQQDWGKSNSKEWMHIRVVQTAVSPLECSGQEASKSISYFSYLARDCSILENCSLWQIQLSTWCLHGNLPPVSKSLRLRKNFFLLF